MQPILSVTVPFFALVLAGWLGGRFRVLPEAAIPGLNAFVLYFALPCLLFRFGLSTPLAQLLNPAVLAVWTVAALLIVAGTVAATRSRVGLKEAAFGALVASFPNTGFMGVPMLVALLGPAAAGPVICSVLTDLFVTSSLCIGIAQAHGAAAAHGMRAAVLRALRGALSNPLPWAIVLGAGCSLAGVRLPGPADTVVRMLADASTPVALFTIGTVLWRAGQHTHTRTPLVDYLPVALVKIVVHPALVYALAASARGLGAPLSALQVLVLTLSAALPSASNVSLLAERYGADNGRVARIVLASTVLAFGTFTALAWLLGVGPARQ